MHVRAVWADYLDTDRHGARPSFANVAIGYLKRFIDATFSSGQSAG